jgi:hypothetical protein
MCGGARAGWWAAFLLTLTPTWFGHMFNNSKDVPFAVGYLWSLALILRMARQYPSPRRSTTVALGIVMGCTLGIRVGGIILWGLALFSLMLWWAAAWLGLAAQKRPSAAGIARSFGATAMSIVISHVVMVAAWPWARQKPFTRPFEALAYFSRFPWPKTPHGVGLSYLVTYSGKMPALLLLLAGTGLAWAILACLPRPRRFLAQPGRDHLVLGAAVLAPLAAIVVNRSVLYNEIRQVLFVQATIVVAGGCTLAALHLRVERRPRLAAGAALLLLAWTAWMVTTMVRLHPYQYVYYSAPSGGLRAAAEKGLDLEYWAHSYREEALFIAEHARGAGATRERPAYVMVLEPELAAAYYFPPWLRLSVDGKHHYAVHHTPIGRSVAGNPIHQVRRDGVILGEISLGERYEAR